MYFHRTLKKNVVGYLMQLEYLEANQGILLQERNKNIGKTYVMESQTHVMIESVLMHQMCISFVRRYHCNINLFISSRLFI